MPPPNIVYMHSHDTGRYIQPYGYALPTPRMQRLAEEGVVFRHAFCANPTCSPSRAALLTGQYAHSCGEFGLVNRGWNLEHPERHLAQTLQKAGYETALAGVQHVTKIVTDQGYTRLLTQEDKALPNAERAVKFIEERRAKPFFLDIGYIETHRIKEGFAAQPDGEAPADSRWLRPPAPFPDNQTTREDFARYVDSARRLDAAHGRVLDALDEAGLRENTLVICTTDHGIAFPGMKCNLTDHGIGVMLMLRGPGGFAGGKVLDALVSQIDVYPTVCEVAGIPKPAWLQGFSLAPLARGERAEIREEVHAEVNFHACYEPKRAVRTRRYKYIRRYDKRDRVVLPNCDNSSTKEFWLEHGWRERHVDTEQLYDLAFDPHETANRAADPACAQALEEMRGRLKAWMETTGDPLLTRDVLDAPETGELNDTDGHSPGGDPHFPAREWLRKKFGA
ncbi:MAG: sulfatase [Planctomycetota bacterium]|nr:sulfatase [Planctomycetota bacterium]